ncbi:MAG: hypothetical protein UHD07_08045 [Ruminobacter sp.]|nr:hypothetical protein [Ruminobacter sp.]
MLFNLLDVVLKDITMFAERNSVNKVILFGSRVRHYHIDSKVEIYSTTMKIKHF